MTTGGQKMRILEVVVVCFTLDYFPSISLGTVENCKYIQGPPKKCIHTLTKENSKLYNRLL